LRSKEESYLAQPVVADLYVVDLVKLDDNFNDQRIYFTQGELQGMRSESAIRSVKRVLD